MSKAIIFIAAGALVASMSAFAADPPNLSGQAAPSKSTDANAPATPSGAQKSIAGPESARPDTDSQAAAKPVPGSKPMPQSAANSGSSSMPAHHAMRGMKKDKATDNIADKLNACQVNAAPNSDAAQCMRQAEAKS